MRNFRIKGTVVLALFVSGSGLPYAAADVIVPTVVQPTAAAPTPSPYMNSESAVMLRIEQEVQESEISGISSTAVRAPFGRFLLVKQGSRCLAHGTYTPRKGQVRRGWHGVAWV